MAKVSRELREKLLQQRRDMTTSGVIISLKDFTKMRVRLLPCTSDLPGVKVTSYFCPSLNERKSTISPATFGKPCPIAAAMADIRRRGDKDEIERARNHVREIVEFYLPVIDRSEETENGVPRIRVFPAKRSIYLQIQNRLLDEDLDDDITDAAEGRDILIKREGTGLQTEWKAVFMDTSPLHPDAKVRKELLKQFESFDVWASIYQPDHDVLAAMYEGLTGSPLPKSEATSASAPAKRKAAAAVADDDDAIEVGMTVSFESDGESYVGKVVQIDGKNAVVEVDGEEWDVTVANLTPATATPASSKKEDDEEEAEESDDETESDDDSEDEEDEDDEEEDSEDEEDEEEAEDEEVAPVVSRRKKSEEPAAPPSGKVARKPVARPSASQTIASKKGKK